MGFSTFPDPDTQPVTSTPITLGYAEITANSAAFTAIADITGLSVTVNVSAGRRIRVSAKGALAATSGTPGWGSMYIHEAGVMKANWRIDTPLNVSEGVMPSVVLSPSAGAHTYYVRAECDSGTCVLAANGNEPAYILVEDITGSAQPVAPASTPVGVLAQSATGLSIAGFSTQADVPGSTLNIVVPAGRTLRINATGRFGANTTSGHIVGRIYYDGAEMARFNNSDVTAGWTVQSMNSIVHSPSAGAHTYKLTVEKFNGGNTADFGMGQIWIEDITPTPVLASTVPSSVLGYAEVTVNQAGITTTPVDLTGLSVTVTVPAGRRIRITGSANLVNDTADRGASLDIWEGGTRLMSSPGWTPIANWGVSGRPSVVVSPTAGTHTYKLRAWALNSGSVTMYTTEGFAWILVEDVTGVSIPTPTLTDYVLNPPRCKAYQTVGQSITTGTVFTSSLIAFAAEAYDTNGMHDNVAQNTRVTINTAGVYHVEMRITFPNSGANSRAVTLRKNNAEYFSDVRAASAGGGVYTSMGMSVDVACAVGDYFEIAAYQDTGSSVTTVPGESLTYLSARWVAP